MRISIQDSARLGMAIVIILALSGCGLLFDPITCETDFKEVIPGIELNTAIRLRISDQLYNDFAIGSSFDLLLENVSDQKIWFPIGYGLRVFTYSEMSQEWLELGNRVEYVSGLEDILDPQGGGNWLAVVTANPELPPSNNPVSVRVLVAGEILEEGNPTGENVGAYLDVTLNPQ